MELFHSYGQTHSAQELFCWYHHAEKLVKKRDHAHGSKDVREAAQLRFRVYGRYGRQGH